LSCKANINNMNQTFYMQKDQSLRGSYFFINVKLTKLTKRIERNKEYDHNYLKENISNN